MKKIRVVFIFIFLGILLFLMYSLLFPFSKIHSVDLKVSASIKLNSLYVQKEPEIVSYLQSYKGRYLWRMDLKKIVKKIKSIYSGGEVYIKRKFPNRLTVFLKEETTALLLLKPDNFFYSISQEGNIGVKKGKTESLNFPVLRGQSFEKSASLRKRVLKILFDMPKLGNSFSLENISEVLYNKDNDSLLFYLVSDYFIVEIQSLPSSKTIKNIDFVLNYLRQKGQTGALIDARLDKKIIVKKIK